MGPELLIAVDYAAPGSCPNAETFAGALQDLGMTVVRSQGAAKHASVLLREKKGAYTLELHYDDALAGREKRELRDARCDVLVQSASMMVAVWSGVVLPDHAAKNAPLAPPPKVAMPEAPRHETGASARPRAMLQRFDLRGSPVHTWGLGAGMEGGEVGVRAHVGAAGQRGWAFGLGVGYGGLQVPEAEFRQLYAPIHACPGVWSLSVRVEFHACARAEVGVLYGRALSGASPSPQSRARAWAALGASAELQWALTPRWAVALELSPTWVATRDEFTVAEKLVFSPDSWALRGAVGLRMPLRGAFF